MTASASPSPRHIEHLAGRVGLTWAFHASVQTPLDQIAALPAAPPGPLPGSTVPIKRQEAAQATPFIPRENSPSERAEQPSPLAKTPDQAAKRQRLINEILGHPEPKPRRRWRR
jgi:hypothetical protein